MCQQNCQLKETWCEESESGAVWLDSISKNCTRSPLLHQGGHKCHISDRHQGSATPLHHWGRLRGQEVKSSKRRHRQGEGKFEKQKKAPKEVEHPVLNQGYFLKKPAFPLSRLSHLWSPQPPASLKEQDQREELQPMVTLSLFIKMLKGNLKSVLVSLFICLKKIGGK